MALRGLLLALCMAVAAALGVTPECSALRGSPGSCFSFSFIAFSSTTRQGCRYGRDACLGVPVGLAGWLGMAAGLGRLLPPADPHGALSRRGKAGTSCPFAAASVGLEPPRVFAGLVRLLRTRGCASPNPAAPLQGWPATSTGAWRLVKLVLGDQQGPERQQRGRGLRCVPAADPPVGSFRWVNAGHCGAGHPAAVPSWFPAHE